MRRVLRFALPAALLALLAACAAPAPPPDRYYRIEVAPPPAAPAAIGKVVVVLPVEASGVASERPLVFKAPAPGSPLQQYHYHFWAEPLPSMLSESLARYLRAALGEQQVFTRAMRVSADLLVRPRLRRLEQISGDGTQEAELSIQFAVTDAANTPVFLLDFEQREPAASAAPGDYVAAQSRLMARAYAQLATRLLTVYNTNGAR